MNAPAFITTLKEAMPQSMIFLLFVHTEQKSWTQENKKRQGHNGHINRCSSISGSFLRPVTLCFGFLLFQIFLIRRK